ncbi:exported hypothetical protein [Xenorhabdus szentirmaii DSM 16338]|uniref:Uncharacterized protein n=1 Tax=Xenorhabdus szentirmaii DSM 16338 TaxID=1427518 RepID=W1IRN8_9GAMM|nr:exported hypothetical protein [Xenorhabdus szentirmaii DSM 16338]
MGNYKLILKLFFILLIYVSVFFISVSNKSASELSHSKPDAARQPRH